MAFEKIVTRHGNFAEVTRKAVNAANQIRSRMFGKINPYERITIIRKYAQLLLDYAEALELIWNKEKLIQEGIIEDKPYLRVDKEVEDEDIPKPNGNGKGSRERLIRNGDKVSE